MGIFSDFIRDLAKILDTAIPASPTADSINERIVALDDLAYEPTLTSVAVDLNAIASTTIINVTEQGRLINIGIIVTNALVGSVAATLDITIDGGTKRSFTLWGGTDEFWIDGDLMAWATLLTFGGKAIHEKMVIPFHIPYAASLLIAIDVTDASGTAGDEVTVKVIKGLKL